MADSLGNVQIPALATDTPIGDPVLSVLLQFWKQLLTNALTSVWAVACPRVPVVKTTDWRNPTDKGAPGLALTSTELPALFIDRTGYEASIWEGADYAKIPSHVRLWWVLPRLELKWRRQRATIMQAAQAAIIMGTEWNMRAPGLVFAGDTDPQAATKGSYVWAFANLWSLPEFKKCGPDRVLIDMGSEGKQSFDCMLWNIDLLERLVIDPFVHGVPLAGFDDSVSDGDTTNAPGVLINSISDNLRITSVTPATGTHLGGTVFTLLGTNIVSGATCTIGGAPCTLVTPIDATQFTATSPAGTVGARDIVVTNPGGESATLSGAWTYS